MAITGGNFSRDKQLLEVSFPENIGNETQEHDVVVSGSSSIGGNTVLSNKAVIKQTPNCYIKFYPTEVSGPSQGSCYNSSVEIQSSGIVTDSLVVESYPSGMASQPMITTVNNRQFIDFCILGNASEYQRSGEIIVSGVDKYGERREASLTVSQSAGSRVTIQLAASQTTIDASQTTATLSFSVLGGFLTRGTYNDNTPFTNVINKSNNYTFVINETPGTGNITGGSVIISFNQNKSYSYPKEYVVCLSGLSVFNESLNGSSVSVVSNDVVITQSPRRKTGNIKLIAVKDSIVYNETSVEFIIQQTNVNSIGWYAPASSPFATGVVSGNKLTVSFGENTSSDETRKIIAVVTGLTVDNKTVYGYGEVTQGKVPSLKVEDKGYTAEVNFVSQTSATSQETSRTFYYQAGEVTSIGVNPMQTSTGISSSSVNSVSSGVTVNFAVNTSNATDMAYTVTLTGTTANGSMASATYNFTQSRRDVFSISIYKKGNPSVVTDVVENSVTSYNIGVTAQGVSNVGVYLVSATGGTIYNPRVGTQIQGDFLYEFAQNASYRDDYFYEIRLSGLTTDTGEQVLSNVFAIRQKHMEGGEGSISFLQPEVSVEGIDMVSSGNAYDFLNCDPSSVSVSEVEYGPGNIINTGALATIDLNSKTVKVTFKENISTTATNTYTVRLTATDFTGSEVTSNDLVISQGPIEEMNTSVTFTDETGVAEYGTSRAVTCDTETVYILVTADHINFDTTKPNATAEGIVFSFNDSWLVNNGVGRIKGTGTLLKNESTADIPYGITVTLRSQPIQSLYLNQTTCRTGSQLYIYLKDVDEVNQFSEDDIRKMILEVSTPAETGYDTYAIPYTASKVTWLVKPEEVSSGTVSVTHPSSAAEESNAFVISRIDNNTNDDTGSRDVWKNSAFTYKGYVFTTSSNLVKNTKVWKASRTYYSNGTELPVTDDTDTGFTYISDNYSTTIENTVEATGTEIVTFEGITGQTTVRRVGYSPAEVIASPTGGKVTFTYDNLNGDFSSPEIVYIGEERPADATFPAGTNNLVFTYNANYEEGVTKEVVFYLKKGEIKSNTIKVIQEPFVVVPGIEIELDTGSTIMDDTGEMIAKSSSSATWTVKYTGITVNTIALVYDESEHIVSVNGSNAYEMGEFTLPSTLDGPNQTPDDRDIKITISGESVLGGTIQASATVQQSGFEKEYSLNISTETSLTYEPRTVYISVATSYVQLNNLFLTGISGDTETIISSLTAVTADETGYDVPEGHMVYKIEVPINESRTDLRIFKTTAIGDNSKGETFKDEEITVQSPRTIYSFIEWLESAQGVSIQATADTVSLSYDEGDVVAGSETGSSTNNAFVISSMSNGTAVITTQPNTSSDDKVTVLTLTATATTGEDVHSSGLTLTQHCRPNISFSETERTINWDVLSTEIPFSYGCIDLSAIASDVDNNHFNISVGAGSSAGEGVVTVTCSQNTGSVEQIGTITLSGINHDFTSTATISIKQRIQEPSLSWVGSSSEIQATATTVTLDYTDWDIRSGSVSCSSSLYVFHPVVDEQNKTVTITVAANTGSARTTTLVLSGTGATGGESVQSGNYTLTQRCMAVIYAGEDKFMLWSQTGPIYIDFTYSCIDLASITVSNSNSYFTVQRSGSRLTITCQGQNTGLSDISTIITLSGTNSDGIPVSDSVNVTQKKQEPSLSWESGPNSFLTAVTLSYTDFDIVGSSVAVTPSESFVTCTVNPSSKVVNVSATQNDTGSNRTIYLYLTGTSTGGAYVDGGTYNINQLCYPSISVQPTLSIAWNNTTGSVAFTTSCLSNVRVISASPSQEFTPSINGNTLEIDCGHQNFSSSPRTQTIVIGGDNNGVTATAQTVVTQEAFSGTPSIIISPSTTAVTTGATTVAFTVSTSYVAFNASTDTTISLAGLTPTNITVVTPPGVDEPAGEVRFDVNVPAMDPDTPGTDSFTSCSNFSLAIEADGCYSGQWSGASQMCLDEISRTITVGVTGTTSGGQHENDTATITQS